MRRSLWALALLLAAAAPLAAQDDTAPEDGARAQALRREIEDRFAQRVKERLGLTDEQLAKLRATSATYGARRRELQARERSLRRALAGQLRPGVAADQDSVARLTSSLMDVRSAYAQTFRDEDREMSRYLNPVQRSQIFVMRERLAQRVREVSEQRREARAERLRRWEERRERREDRGGAPERARGRRAQGRRGPP